MLAQISAINAVQYINLDLSNQNDMEVHMKNGKVFIVSQREDEDYGTVYSVNDEIGVGMESVTFSDIVGYIKAEA
ncbi:hypothetical protein OPFAMLBM_00316 [Aeromonas phage avDM12-TAAL]|nr:hypothetical protein OPFAMLBM_00316 [Aeromonas phage avDM12-TAAL]